MRSRKKAHRRAFTLFEMVIAMFIMAIVMSFAALEFKAVVFTYLDADSHLSAEQQARVAVAKVNDLSRQASVVDGANPTLPVIQPAGNTPSPVLEFTQAQTLDPNSIPTPNGVPAPCYNDSTIFLVSDTTALNGDPILQPHNLVERVQVAPPDEGRSECTTSGQSGIRLIARNVADFTVQKAEPCDDPTGQHCTPYGNGYRIDISVFDYDDHKADQHAGALYHLSAVITPLTFGKSE